LLNHIENVQVAGAENNFLEGCMGFEGSVLASPDIECAHILPYL
jgi:hypothetical protein